ncbi:MAG: lipoyl synthase [Candidatus Omnitrophica bacterium]|nr:lipoyl synthase [Candidatus Omnitrophota bacterium]
MKLGVRREKFPEWLHRSLPAASGESVRRVIIGQRLNTVCEEARCPNRSECYSRQTATFMILGKVCTRHCSFCGVLSGIPEDVSADEPDRIAIAVQSLHLRYVVITSVTRDDLADEGAGQFSRVIWTLKKLIPGIQVEVLTPDFHAREELIAMIVKEKPMVYGHNVETVPRLQPKVRPQASFTQSLRVLEVVKNVASHMITKSGIMLGLGETLAEVRSSARELRSVGCDILTVGQYLKPCHASAEVVRYVPPGVFRDLAEELKGFGFQKVEAGPFVRSSYHAEKVFWQRN